MPRTNQVPQNRRPILFFPASFPHPSRKTHIAPLSAQRSQFPTEESANLVTRGSGLGAVRRHLLALEVVHASSRSRISKKGSRKCKSLVGFLSVRREKSHPIECFGAAVKGGHNSGLFQTAHSACNPKERKTLRHGKSLARV